MLTTRTLKNKDQDLLEGFLRDRRYTSMFMRSNARSAGLEAPKEPFGGRYVGAFERGELRGVVAYCWNGHLTVQASGAALRACLEKLVPPGFFELSIDKRRESAAWLNGMTGDTARVREAMDYLGLEAKTSLEEGLYILPFAERKPAALGGVPITQFHVERLDFGTLKETEVEQLGTWRRDYEDETMGIAITADEGAKKMALWASRGLLFVARDAEGELCGMTGFNAALPDIVQIGGVYTPPSLRRAGIGRSLVSGSLDIAEKEGASESVLFTNNPFAARAYESLGFRRIGDFSLLIC